MDACETTSSIERSAFSLIPFQAGFFFAPIYFSFLLPRLCPLVVQHACIHGTSRSQAQLSKCPRPLNEQARIFFSVDKTRPKKERDSAIRTDARGNTIKKEKKLGKKMQQV